VYVDSATRKPTPIPGPARALLQSIQIETTKAQA
jgi:acyl-CoA thioesterase FadM